MSISAGWSLAGRGDQLDEMDTEFLPLQFKRRKGNCRPDFFFVGAVSPRTVFQKIFELRPRYYFVGRDGTYDVKPCWEFNFVSSGQDSERSAQRSKQEQV